MRTFRGAVAGCADWRYCLLHGDKALRTARGRRPDAGRVRASQAPRLAAQDPSLSLRFKAELRSRRRHLPPGARGPAHRKRALHRGRHAGGLRDVDTRRAAVAPRYARGARLRPRGGALQATRPLGCDLEDQRDRPALARPGLRRPARTRDVVLSRILQPARSQDAARIFRAVRPAARRSEAVDFRREERVAGRRGARHGPPLSAAQRPSPEGGGAPRPVRAPGRRAAAVPASARAAREAGALEEAEGKIKSGLTPISYFSSTLPIFSSASLRRAASRSQYFWKSGASRQCTGVSTFSIADLNSAEVATSRTALRSFATIGAGVSAGTITSVQT